MAMGNQDIARANLGLRQRQVDAQLDPNSHLNRSNASFTSPIQAMDGSGNPVFIQADNRGNVRPVEGFAPNNPIKTIDNGTETVVVDSRTGQVLSKQVRNNLQEASDKAQGQVEGKRKGEFPVLKRKARATLSSLKRQWQTVDKSIDKAISQAGLLTTGTIGSVLSAVPGTPAYDLKQTLLTIQSNIGFDKLQNMRDNSPTGGALGQVSNLEIQLLQSVQGALSPGQSEEQFVENLASVRQNLAALADEREQAYAQTFGAVNDTGDEISVPVPGAAGIDAANAIPLASENDVTEAMIGKYVTINGNTFRVDP